MSAPVAVRRAGVPSGVSRTLLVAGALLAPSLALGPFGSYAPSSLHGQERPTPAATPPTQAEPLAISPGGAFWRALVFPGWGHAAIGAHTRGGFYFVAQSATVYTLLRTRARVGEAQDRVRFREGVLLDRLAAEGVTDPDLIGQRLDSDEALGELRGLLDSRKEQQEDMVALGIFLFFLSGADAYVSAHLARFPEPLELDARPAPDGSLEVGLRLRLGR